MPPPRPSPVDVALPGFINLRLADPALEGLLDAVLAAPGAWGTVEPVRPRRVNVEFVSANPTGPLHIGNARGRSSGICSAGCSRPVGRP